MISRSIYDKWNEFPNCSDPASGDSFILPCRGEILNPQVGKINYSPCWMYLVPAVFRAHQRRYLQHAVSARGNQEKTRERVIASEYRIFLFLRESFLFFTFRTSFKASQNFHLSLSPPLPYLSLFLFCQAIMRDRNFPRARSGGNTGKYRAITIGVQSIYLSCSRREIHGSFCLGFCNRIERSRRADGRIFSFRKFRIARYYESFTANLFSCHSK